MSIIGSSWDDDEDDYDGPIFGSGRDDWNKRKEIKKELKEKYNYDNIRDVPEHLVWEKFFERELN